MAKSRIIIDEGSDKNVATHTFTEGSEERNIERIALASGPLALPDTPQVSEETSTGDYPANPASVVGSGGITIQALLSATSQTAKANILFYDANDVLLGVSDEYTFEGGDDTRDSKYIGTAVFIDNTVMGVAGIKIRITTVPTSGNVSFAIACI